ncbi:hypothetical protein F4778DRAFT_781017 [Xylariomycetidae sp. FL2044]|nr:hypothetical protein F4778DRAFT_781017 [Xylariomycetidae sp. FL2044]
MMNNSRAPSRLRGMHETQGQMLQDRPLQRPIGRLRIGRSDPVLRLAIADRIAGPPTLPRRRRSDAAWPSSKPSCVIIIIIIIVRVMTEVRIDPDKHLRRRQPAPRARIIPRPRPRPPTPPQAAGGCLVTITVIINMPSTRTPREN